MTQGRQQFVLLNLVFVLLFLILPPACAFAPTHAIPNSVLVRDIEGPTIIPLSVHYLTDEKDIRKTFQGFLERSNETLMPHGVLLVVWTEDRRYNLPSEVDGRVHRQLLAAHVVKDGTLHVFVPDKVSLEPGDNLLGAQSNQGDRNYIIVRTTAAKTTLAHEVGHAMGLDHVEDGVRDNVMSQGRNSEEAVFTHDQGEKLRVGARIFVTRDW